MSVANGKPDRARPADHAQRTEALDIAGSFIVQAPAGSGKTSLLVKRALKLLAQAQAPEEILCITFTRKATGEMHQRILEAICRVDENTEPADDDELMQLAKSAHARDRDMQWALARNPSRLRIQTIDSLCADLVRAMPWSARYGSAPSILEEQDAEQAYQEAARRTLNLPDEDAGACACIEELLLLVDASFPRAQSLLATMLGKRDQWLRNLAAEGRAQFERMWLEAIEADIVSIRDALTRSLGAPLIELSRFAAQSLTGSDDILVNCASLESYPEPEAANVDIYRALCRLLVIQSGSETRFRKRYDKSLGFPPGCAEKSQMQALVENVHEDNRLRELLGIGLALPDTEFSAHQWRILDALLTALPLAAAQLRLLFKEQHCGDFVEIAQRAEMALGEDDAPTDLALVLDYQLRHILMDEAQDSAQGQIELLTRLTRGWQDGDGRTLFIVGDPMQSIYRFRQADVSQFLGIARFGIGDIRLRYLSLSTNFRSDSPLVDWCNATFSGIFPGSNDPLRSAIRFTPSTASGKHAAAVTTPVVFAGGDTHTDHGNQALIDAVLHYQSVHRLTDNEQCPSIAILGRAKTHLLDVAEILHTRGIAFTAVELESLAERSGVQDLLCLCRGLIDPGDRIAWLAILRAPWCGMTLSDLTALRDACPDESIWSILVHCANLPAKQMAELFPAMSADGAERFRDIAQRLLPGLATFGRCFTSVRVRGAWLRLRGPDVLTEDDIDDCEAVLSLIQRLEIRHGKLTGRLIDNHLRRLWASSSQRSQIQLLTIHKAKGLEFDCVALTALHRPPGSSAGDLLRWVRSEDKLLVATLAPKNESDQRHNRYLQRIENERQRNENLRLLYVACTRAVHQLILGAGLRAAQGDAPKPPDARSLLALLWPVLADQFADAGAGENGSEDREQGSDQALPQLQRMPTARPAYALPEPVGLPKPDPLISPVSAVTEQITFDWAGTTARAVGTVLHRMLWQIGDSGWPEWKKISANSHRRLGRQLLQNQPGAVAESSPALNRLERAIRNIKADSRADWIFSSRHRDIRCEWALTGLANGSLTSIVIDRSFLDASGIRWIIDFKFSEHLAPDTTAFVASEQERYTPQLHQYAQLVHNLRPAPIRVALYFPLLNEWLDWPWQPV